MANETTVYSGTFTLRIDTDGATDSYSSTSHQSTTSFEGQYNIPCPADLIPFIVVPYGKSVNGISYTNLIGYCGLLIDNRKGTSTYVVVGDVGPSKNDWGEVSLKAAWNLGYTKNEANGSRGPKSNFTIILYLDSKPKWTNLGDLEIQIVNEGQKRGGTYQTTYSNTSYSNVVIGDSKSLIDPSTLKSRIITLDRNSPKLDFNKLKSNGIVAVSIESGRLYNTVHQKVYYRNPKIASQVAAANAANVPFSLFSYIDARNSVEAEDELYELYFTVNKYPPPLGAWFKLNLTKSKAVNNIIIDKYYEGLVKLGLKNKIGLYATKSQLDKLDWKKYSEDWYLWLDSHIKDLSEIDKLLTPEFFMLN